MNTKKVAIVHDWLVGGGAEKVVQELHALYPGAPIYTSYATQEWRDKLDGKVVTGSLQHWPFSKLRKFLGVKRIWWFSHLDLSEYDLVISSSGNGEAKDVTVRDGATHICYCHAPTHFYWRSYDQYMKSPGFGVFDPLARLGLKLLVKPLRNRDYKAAQNPDFFIANSQFIADEIKQYYGRDSIVINPPVDVERFTSVKNTKRQGFVTMGRQVAYKQTEIIIDACNDLDLPLTVIGRGPEHDNLVRRAGPNVTFKTNVSDDQMPSELASAEAFIFAAEEDFGIAPVEAMAAGTPVIAYKAGGALDYVTPGISGEFFEEQTAESLKKSLAHFNAKQYDSQTIKKHAGSFDSQNFRTKLKQYIQSIS
ncbi:MAG: glycosyltransferase [Candidatus Saccharibacteria bacterium]|nr:glycosyltransferase [Candidatus Saccharibacteria bacterium]